MKEYNQDWQKIIDLEVTNKGKIKQELDWIMIKLKRNMKLYGQAYPAPATKDGKYPIIENNEWTNSFWTGMLWIAYEYTNDEEFRKLAEFNTKSFINRLNTEYEIDHHDIGFLYSLSTVAAYKVTGQKIYKEASIKAADLLCNRFIESAGIIQAWGPKYSENENRAIIDSLLNIPLLYWAFEVTSNQKYKEIANTHFKKVINNIIRDDNTSYHTFYFDYETGTPLYGKTRQGYRDDSCWARGQAWAIYGQTLAYKYNKEPFFIENYDRVLEYFIKNLPSDAVAFWDLWFTDENPSDRDTSSNAIVLCGLIERSKQIPNDDKHKYLIKVILSALQARYTTKNEPEKEGLLNSGVYSWHSGRGIDEANIWGDYYYLEALYRLYANRWNSYW